MYREQSCIEDCFALSWVNFLSVREKNASILSQDLRIAYIIRDKWYKRNWNNIERYEKSCCWCKITGEFHFVYRLIKGYKGWKLSCVPQWPWHVAINAPKEVWLSIDNYFRYMSICFISLDLSSKLHIDTLLVHNGTDQLTIGNDCIHCIVIF